MQRVNAWARAQEVWQTKAGLLEWENKCLGLIEERRRNMAGRQVIPKIKPRLSGKSWRRKKSWAEGQGPEKAVTARRAGL
jgi:hypothetical protein